MSGEPKTHTPEPMTLEEAMVRVAWQGDGYRLEPVAPRRTRHIPTRATSWRAVHATGYAKDFDTWEEAASYVLGVRVVARDEAAELRAALDAARDAMVSALAYHHHSLSNPVKEELNAAINRAGRALAGGESQK